MVYFMENPIKKWMIWGYHYFWKHPYGCLEDDSSPFGMAYLEERGAMLVSGSVHLTISGWKTFLSRKDRNLAGA